eukprot:SAG31_NODE_1428_length_8391_cov_4.335866_7_plen_76_part_00
MPCWQLPIISSKMTHPMQDWTVAGDRKQQTARSLMLLSEWSVYCAQCFLLTHSLGSRAHKSDSTQPFPRVISSSP